MKELYLYSPIYSFVAEGLISQLEDNIDNDVTLRVMTPGGSVFAAYGIYAKIKEHGNVNLKIDGNADSAGSFLPFYAKSTECLDVSRFTFHRADMFVEDEAAQVYLDGVNKDLKNQMLKKINADEWFNVTGITIDEMFDPKTRKDITITGAQAKKIGLVQKVTKLTPELQKELAAYNNSFASKVEAKTHQTEINMTIEKLKAEHPTIFAAAIELGVSQERDRINSCLVFLEADPKGVKAAIESGKPLTHTQMSEFALALMSKNSLKEIESANPTTVTTAPVGKEKTEKEKELSAFAEALDKNLGLKK